MDHYGPRCMQPAIGLLGGGEGDMSEDCLTLNIWAPPAADRAAVMFWIHGGAFLAGSGSFPYFNGASLARQGVVVVTINYRLGLFGFFAHPQLTREAAPEPAANFGIMDQVAALHGYTATLRHSAAILKMSPSSANPREASPFTI